MTGIHYREDLIALLYQAAELEHGLACSYLFTAFSLKEHLDEGLTPEQLEKVLEWEQTFIHIAIQEMGHLLLATDLVVAIGGAPHLDRPNFPQPTSYYLPDYDLALRPFSKQTLEHFIYVERPESVILAPVLKPQANTPIIEPRDNLIGPDPEQFDTVADIYDQIAEDFKSLVERYGEQRVFVARPQTAFLYASLGLEEIDPLTNLEAVLEAIELIVTEGEGDRGNRADSHYGLFKKIHAEYTAMLAESPDFEPARPVLNNPFPRTPPASTGSPSIVTDPVIIEMMDLFDAGYATMLQTLGRVFAPNGETEDDLKLLLDVALTAMSRGLAPLGNLLMRLPAGSDYPGMNAGPSFGLYHAVHTMPYRQAAWQLMIERYRELAEYARTISVHYGDVEAVNTVATVLDELANKLATRQ
ncbi:MAG TPA: ferritin-like domain-containing protein [Dehalococcoidia bacterium]|nr:ferritin-like domain-containing protein [Dehalococcoidia bacterium]